MSAFDPLRTFVSSEMLPLMTDVDRHWSLSNPGPDKLQVWLEPWAVEFEVAIGSTIALRASGRPTEGIVEDVEWLDHHLVVWVSGPGTVDVFIDGTLQEPALVPIPEGMTKQMLNLVFAGHPAARLGGRAFDVTEGIPRWQRLRLRLGL
jgi:hypothetical protein